MGRELRYRDWLCEQSIHGFEATHPDFDLSRGDDRVVYAETLEDLAVAVDDWFDDQASAWVFDEDQFWRDSPAAESYVPARAA